jgi:signal transduction histidine kinase
MTFQRKLFLAFCLMVLPVVLLGLEALRSNQQERRALEALGGSMARTRTFAELETAMFNQTGEVWELLTGMDPGAPSDFRVHEQVIDYWQERWESELRPDEMDLAEDFRQIHESIVAVSERIFGLYAAGEREEAYKLAETELKGRLLPALTQKNREIYGATRERSVKRAYERLETILAAERRVLFAILALSLLVGIGASMLISRGLSRPLRRLKETMALVGQGRLDNPVGTYSSDEVGDLARAFARMQESLKASHETMARLNADLQRQIEKLERAQAQLVQSEKLASIGEMSAAVAHGLRNPLASLRAAAQLALHQMRDTPPAQEHLRAIVEEVDRLDRRITHLLSFSRPASLHAFPEQLPRLVEAVMPTFKPHLEQLGIELDLNLSPDLPPVHLDPMQLEQALIEVIANAIDAMPQGGRLTIHAWTEAAVDGSPGSNSRWVMPEALPVDASRIVLEIADTGEGIPELVLPSVGEPFFTTRPEGTGLGLATAKRYVIQNGGTLEISSVARRGTTVRIKLPAASEQRPEARESAAAVDEPVSASSH